MLGEGFAERGKGVGARRVGARGWGGWWGKGVGRGFNRSFEQNRYRIIQFSYRNAHYETKSAENRDFEGNPPVMTSRSRKYIIISPEKSPKTRCVRDFT